jgi:hypothetical protein
MKTIDRKPSSSKVVKSVLPVKFFGADISLRGRRRAF